MTKYSIEAGEIMMGVWEATAPDEALDLYAKDAGYLNYADLLDRVPDGADETVHELVVDPNIPSDITQYLIRRYALDGPECVRYTDVAEYGPGALPQGRALPEGALECYGIIPNSIYWGWFYVGTGDDVREAMAQDRSES
jgi:hypothetical protein